MIGTLALPRVLWARIPHGRLAKMAATVAVGTVIVGGASLIPGATTTPVGPSTADWWVATNGNDTTCAANPNNQAFPCLTFNQAYQLASLGDTVEVRAGSYASQQILEDSSKAGTGDAADVVFQPATGATVTVNGLSIGSGVLNTDGPDHLTISGISDSDTNPDTCGGWSIFGDSNDITFDGVTTCNFYINTVTGSGASVTVASGLTIENSEFTGCNTVIGGGAGGCGNMKLDGIDNFVFSGNYVHDFRIVQGSGAHFECMFFSDVTNATIEGNRFENCEFYDILVQRCAPVNGGRCLVSDLTFQNNWFDQPWDGVGGQGRTGAIAFSPRNQGFSNMLIRFNSFYEGTGISVNDDSDGSTYSNFRIIGNLLLQQGCYASATYAYNLVLSGGATCAATDSTSTGSAVYTSNAHLQSGGNWHLKSGANPAVGFVTPTTSDYTLADDFDGDIRSAPRDAGSDQR